MLVLKNKFMKKYILIVIAILVLGWLVFDKVKNVGLTEEFVVKQDSLVHVVDSLHEDNHQKELQIYALEELDYDLQDQLDSAKGKIKIITKWVDSSKKKVDTYTEQELVSSFNQRYPTDTVTNPLPLAQPVLVSAAKDLIELDGAKEELIVKDDIIALNEQRIVGKDSVISLYVQKEFNYKNIVNNQQIQIGDWKDQYTTLKIQNTKLKIRAQIGKIGAGLAIAGLTFLLVK
jgi:hypothetical protein